MCGAVCGAVVLSLAKEISRFAGDDLQEAADGGGDEDPDQQEGDALHGAKRCIHSLTIFTH